jgi:hypothetical protein
MLLPWPKMGVCLLAGCPALRVVPPAMQMGQPAYYDMGGAPGNAGFGRQPRAYPSGRYGNRGGSGGVPRGGQYGGNGNDVRHTYGYPELGFANLRPNDPLFDGLYSEPPFGSPYEQFQLYDQLGEPPPAFGGGPYPSGGVRPGPPGQYAPGMHGQPPPNGVSSVGGQYAGRGKQGRYGQRGGGMYTKPVRPPSSGRQPGRSVDTDLYGQYGAGMPSEQPPIGGVRPAPGRAAPGQYEPRFDAGMYGRQQAPPPNSGGRPAPGRAAPGQYEPRFNAGMYGQQAPPPNSGGRHGSSRGPPAVPSDPYGGSAYDEPAQYGQRTPGRQPSPAMANRMKELIAETQRNSIEAPMPGREKEYEAFQKQASTQGGDSGGEGGSSPASSARPKPPPIDDDRRNRSPGLTRNFYEMSSSDFKKSY